MWLLSALFILCAVNRDKQHRANTEAKARQPASTSRQAYMNASAAIPAPTSGSDVTTGVVTPHGSPMLGAHSSVANMLFSSVGDGRGKNGSASMDGPGVRKQDNDGNAGGGDPSVRPIRLPERTPSLLAGMNSSAQPGVHPSPVSSSGEPFLPNFGMDIAGPGSSHTQQPGHGEEATSSSAYVSDMDAALPQVGRLSHQLEVGPISQGAMDTLGARSQEPVRPPLGTMHDVQGNISGGVDGTDSELMIRNAAGVLSPVRTPAGGAPSTSSHHLVNSQYWHGGSGPAEEHSEVDAMAHMQVQKRDAGPQSTGTPKSGAGSGVRRMKDAVHRAMMEMQHDMHEQQLKVFSVLGRGGYGTVYHGGAPALTMHLFCSTVPRVPRVSLVLVVV